MDTNESRSPITAESLDRLAEGTLPEAERRALLARLDTEPDAWRRCALAFLEAQAWRTAFAGMTSADSGQTEAKPDRPAIRPRFRLVSTTLAAGLLISAFLLGRLSDGIGGPGHAQPEGFSVAFESDDRSGAAPPSPTSEGPDDWSVADSFDPLWPHEILPWETGIQAVGFLSVPTDDDPESPMVELPVLTGPGLDDHWLRNQPSFIPEDVRLSWERLGYEVESQRRLVSVQIDDEGRYLTIPVDEVQFRSKDSMTY